MHVPDSALHLAYCSNIHPGERWAEVDAVLRTALPEVRRQLDHRGPMAIGLRLSAAAAATLEGGPHMEALTDFLREGEYYVPTINGFPYGAFHGTRVKERVYEPDWRTPERLDYSNRLARIIANCAASTVAQVPRLSVSTVPGGFRSSIATETDIDALAGNLLAHAAYLTRLRRDTGRLVTVAIEPEPACFLETTEEAVTFFADYLFSPDRIREAGRRSGITLTRDDVADHIGLCLDVCHMAVQFETAAASIRRITGAGISLAKVQLSSALRLPADTAPAAERLLRPYAEDTYLHQVVISTGGELQRYVDLPAALADAQHGRAATGEWRVHFHVPIFVEQLDGFGTTQASVRDVLRIIREESLSPCLEVETNTWDVLPPAQRTTDVCTAIARELA